MISLNRAETIAKTSGSGEPGRASRNEITGPDWVKGAAARPQFGHRPEKEFRARNRSSLWRSVPRPTYHFCQWIPVDRFRLKDSGQWRQAEKHVSEESSPGDDNISEMNSSDPEERRREEFLARAREAEARAAKTTDAMLRESWLKVAQGYHELARKK